jgi:hypothetical protein
MPSFEDPAPSPSDTRRGKLSKDQRDSAAREEQEASAFALESFIARQSWTHEQCSFLRLCHQQYGARPWKSTFMMLLTASLGLGDVVEAKRIAGESALRIECASYRVRFV